MPDVPPIAPHLSGLSVYIPGQDGEQIKRDRGLKRVLRMASNENPFGASPRVFAAMMWAMREPHWYPNESAVALRKALADHLEVPLADVVITNGSGEAIGLLVQTVAAMGGEVVIP